MDPLTYITQLGDFADFSIRSATISFLMRPGEGQNLAAARMIIAGMVADLGNPAMPTRCLELRMDKSTRR